MLAGLFIITDTEFDSPLYANPELDLTDDELYDVVCSQIADVVTGKGPVNGTMLLGDQRLVWRHNVAHGLSIAAVIDGELSAIAGQSYLKEILERLLDKVGRVQAPAPEDVATLVVDVVPPWDVQE